MARLAVWFFACFLVAGASGSLPALVGTWYSKPGFSLTPTGYFPQANLFNVLSATLSLTNSYQYSVMVLGVESSAPPCYVPAAQLNGYWSNETIADYLVFGTNNDTPTITPSCFHLGSNCTVQSEWCGTLTSAFTGAFRFGLSGPALSTGYYYLTLVSWPGPQAPYALALQSAPVNP
jgi:hypothetical protein